MRSDARGPDTLAPAAPTTARTGARRRWWWPALLIMAGVWWLSSSADTPGPALAHPWDWAAHAVTYFALGYCLTRATGRPALGLVLAVWWGALDEVHQAFVPGREAGIVDWLFDLAGAWLGTVLARRAVRPPATNAGPGAESASPVAVLLEFPG